MRDIYHEDLDSLSDSLVEMTRLVAGAMGRATQALIDADVQLADNVIASDDTVDALRADIESRAFDILARQQPVASDLRTLIATLRMVTDLERSGDLAEHIAEVARRRYPNSAVPASVRAIVLEMGQVSERIIAKAGSVVATRDIVAAREIERDDDVMDDLHRKMLRTIFGGSWAEGVECAVDVALLGRYYERYSDHAVSVARSVIYLVTGEVPEPEAVGASGSASS
ncbi:MAG: phosphate signaling complex protein PhoU [Actinomycetes bacterium]